MGCFISLFFTMMPCIRRAIWSAPPPVPAGTTNSTGLLGSHAAAGALANAAATASAQPANFTEPLMTFECSALIISVSVVVILFNQHDAGIAICRIGSCRPCSDIFPIHEWVQKYWTTLVEIQLTDVKISNFPAIWPACRESAETGSAICVVPEDCA